ncbi:YiiX/YebB-like N1pC/P60 family cysteine hydrolase [Bacillus sp. DJP31]|uniref:YiiX/YebB-like N1pC/P60 family cysteine hydrolase n=1 Tax=Bacillus sp. DJP31 TaxID=3409789 RepID=UPI003BB558D3
MKVVKSLGPLALIILLSAQPVLATSSSSSENMNRSDSKNIEAEQRAELRQMWGKHNVEVLNSNGKEEVGTFGVDPGYTGIGSKGDILIALDSITDHVALVKDTYILIESHPDNPGGDVAYRDNNWKERYTQIKGMRVSGATSTNKTNAVNYAIAQLGEGYNIYSGRWTTDEWYCSKLVWRAWYGQGFDLEGRNLETRGTHVTPGDILDSPLTTVFY